jgi:hypothetical protein
MGEDWCWTASQKHKMTVKILLLDNMRAKLKAEKSWMARREGGQPSWRT